MAHFPPLTSGNAEETRRGRHCMPFAQPLTVELGPGEQLFAIRSAAADAILAVLRVGV
jgi:hypothetical protein